jgi:hypothetical protein
MVQTLPFENSARDLVNFGIAFYNQFSLVLEDMQRKTADGYQELVNRGAQDKSELAEGLRKLLTEGLGFLGLIQVSRPAANRPVTAAAAEPAEIILPKKKTRKTAKAV